MITAVLTFLTMAALDFVWVFYTRAVQAEAHTAAASTASLIALLAALNTLAYVDNHWMIVATMAGAFAGTWFAHDKRVLQFVDDFARAVRQWRVFQLFAAYRGGK